MNQDDFTEVKRMYVAGKTLAEIGGAFGVSRQRASQFCAAYGLTSQDVAAKCRRCGKSFFSARRVGYCSLKCRCIAERYVLCKCGKQKSINSVACAKCRVYGRKLGKAQVTLAATYYRQGMTYEQIGKVLKVSAMTAWKWLKLSGVKSRARGAKPRKAS